MIGGDQGQNSFGDIPGLETRSLERSLIIIMNFVPVEAFFINFPSAPQEVDYCFLKRKKISEVLEYFAAIEG